MLAAFKEVLIVAEHVVEHLRIHLAVKVDRFSAAKLYAWIKPKKNQSNCIGDELLSIDNLQTPAGSLQLRRGQVETPGKQATFAL